MPLGTKVKEHNQKRWARSDHDLDFVFKRDGIEYGCEIKDTLGYIDKDILDIKIEMCSFFNVKPLFIMRYAPKTYINLINENHGFAFRDSNLRYQSKRTSE